MESQILSVIRMWAAMAWADGVLAEAEAEGLRRLIRTADLTSDERAAALGFLDSHTPLSNTYLDDLDSAARRGIYRAACRMALVDHVFAHAERTMLDRLRGLLGLSEAQAAECEAAVGLP
jgi:uncharacterized tellurite resistance protein B-like protein